MREPRRSALGLLFTVLRDEAFETTFVKEAFSGEEISLLQAALHKGINAPKTSSVGRLWDGLGALIGLPLLADYEAQVPMLMEHLAFAHPTIPKITTPMTITRDSTGALRLDWSQLVLRALEIQRKPPGLRELTREAFCYQVHHAFVGAVVQLAVSSDYKTILASGGAFQNAILVRLLRQKCCDAGLEVLMHRGVPPGDGGLALGQLAAELMRRNAGASFPCV